MAAEQLYKSLGIDRSREVCRGLQGDSRLEGHLPVCACVRACVCVCKSVRKREGETNKVKERGERGECDDAKGAFKNRLDSGRGWEETTSTCTSRTAVKAQLGRVCYDR